MSSIQIRFHSRDDTPYDLGHAFAEVGPGWWDLVREAFAEIERDGGLLHLTQQKAGLLDILPLFGDRDKSQALLERYQRRSARICEVCGGPAVPITEFMPRPTRTHCDGCHQRERELVRDGVIWYERALWMEHAGVWLPEWG